MKAYLKNFFLLAPLLLNSLFSASAQNIEYKNLVMEGGGIKGIAYTGALRELENKGILSKIIRVGGTSAGAIQACLFSLGYTTAEIADIVENTPMESFNDDGFVANATKRLVKKYGWYKGESFLEKMREVIALRTTNPDLTFAQLHELAKDYPFRDLYVTGTNLSLQKTEIFSYETYPNMRICDAVRISMSIPIYYEALWLTDEGKIVEKNSPETPAHLFVDGGLLMNYPIDLFDQSKYLSSATDSTINKKTFNPETLGLKFERCEQIDHEISKKKGLAPFEISDMKQYLSALSNIVMQNVHPLRPEDASRTIYINDVDMNPRIRKIPEDEKQKMILAGQQGVIDFFIR